MVSEPYPHRELTKPATKIKGGANNIRLCIYVWQRDYDAHLFAPLVCEVKMHFMPSGQKT